MFTRMSRYWPIPVANHTDAGGRTVEYKRRRFIPAESDRSATQAQVRPGDRLDLISGRTLGHGQLFWHLLDGNHQLLHPLRHPAQRLRPQTLLRVPQLTRRPR